MTALVLDVEPSEGGELKVTVQLGKDSNRLRPVGTLYMPVKDYFLLRSLLETARVMHPGEPEMILPNIEDIFNGSRQT